MNKTVRNTALGFLFATALICFGGCEKKVGQNTSGQQQPQNNIPVDTALQSKIRKFATKPRCKGAFGLYVYDLTADKPLYADNEHMPQPSASCMKLLSGVGGLHYLGLAIFISRIFI